MPGSRVDSGLRPECANSRHSPAGVNGSNRPTAGAPFRSRCERKAPTPFELACYAERGHAAPLSRRGLEASVRSLGAGPRLRPYLAAWERVRVEIAVPRGSSICSSMILLKLIVAPSGPHASPILLQEVGQPIPGPTTRHIVGPATPAWRQMLWRLGSPCRVSPATNCWATWRSRNSARRSRSRRGPRIGCARRALTPVDGGRLFLKPRQEGPHISGLSPLPRTNETITAARRQGQIERRD